MTAEIEAREGNRSALREERAARVKAVLRVASGNFLEMFDFMIFGYFARPIAAAFFPAGSELTSLLLALATFGAAFLMRPVGAVVLGAYIDRHGRRKGLLLTLGLMALGTLSIACMPPYRTAGIVAPLVVVAGRLLQGLSAGVELGGVSIYLAEIAPRGREGLYVSFQSASQQVAVIAAATFGIVLGAVLPPPLRADWGFRIPMLAGCLIVPLLLFLRRDLEETEAFLATKVRPTLGEVGALLAKHAGVVVTGMFYATMSTTFFYVITAFTPTYASTWLGLAGAGNYVTLAVGASNLFWLPIVGALSDRVGRRPILLGAAAAGALTAYPAMAWLTSTPSALRLLVTLLWLSFVYASYNAAMVVHLTEMMPKEVRTSGFSLAYSLATAVFGGFSPFVCSALLARTHNQAIPGAWLALSSLAACAALWVDGKRRGVSAPA